MTTTTQPVPIGTIPPIDHAEAPVLAEEAYRRFVDLLEGLPPEAWGRPTDCEGWTVRDLAGHLVGAMRSAASVRELARQQLAVTRRQRRDGGSATDIMTALQIELTAALTVPELLAEARRLVRTATAGRRRTPGLLRRRFRFPVTLRSGTEHWTLGYLVDVILTRDAWLHRIDLARAIGAEPILTADHDGRIIADVVAEWARRHGQAFVLHLTGPAGGTYTSDAPTGGAPEIELDPVELARILSGRADLGGRHPLLGTEVPF
ncbi:MAG: maleylpyruvate isomerase family mycothiol-dependent enzyme [Acidimicrobiia bacterium]|jgi:uncharacterized protein (TIGR03083 family)